MDRYYCLEFFLGELDIRSGKTWIHLRDKFFFRSLSEGVKYSQIMDICSSHISIIKRLLSIRREQNNLLEDDIC